MKRVLFAIEKWADARKRERGESSTHYGVVGSMLTHKFGVADTFYYDVENESGDVDTQFVAKCAKDRPDMILATCLLSMGDGNIKPQTYGYIRDELKIPVAMLWYESAPDVVRWADAYAPSITVNVFADTRNEWRKWAKHPEKSVHLLDPRDPAIFYSDDTPRGIALSFVGSTFARPDRAMNLAVLWGEGIRYEQFGGVESLFISSIDNYAKILRRSLVTINFTSAVTFRHINARIAEATMCGAMLLQSEDEETAAILDPFREYVPFTETFSYTSHGLLNIQRGDLREKAIHYAYRYASEARRVAERGHSKGIEIFDGRLFWNELFKLVGL